MKSKISCWRFVRSLPMSIRGLPRSVADQSYEHVFDTVAILEDGLKAGASLAVRMRLGTLIVAGSAAALIGGCGAADPPPKPQKPVQLSVSAPADTAVVQSST